MLMAVLPPTELSTWANRVVGIWMKSMPRSSIAAAKPVISPITPPPNATTTLPRSMPRIEHVARQLLQKGEILGVLARRQDHGLMGDAGAFERGLQARQMQRRDMFIRHHGHAFLAQERGDVLAGRIEQTAASFDDIAAFAQRNGDIDTGHGDGSWGEDGADDLPPAGLVS